MDNKDKQALIDGTATIPYKLHILNDDGSIKDTLTEEDIVSTDYEDYRYVDSSSLCIGQFVARKLKGEIKTIDKDLQIEDKEISVEMGVNRNDGSKVYDITIDGKSEQATRSGKNLYNSGNITAVSNGTNNNGVITSNTFSTNNLNLAPYNIVNLEAGTYYLSADIRIISGTPTINKINDYISDAEVVSKPTLSTTKQRYVYKKTYTSATQLTRMLFQFNASANAVVEVSNIMISKENTSYEPYGVSPSPEFPSEIKTVKGIRNLCDGINQNYYLNNTVNLAGLVTGNSGLVIPTNGKTTFTISTNIIQERYRVACINNLLQEEKSTTTAYNGVNKDGKNVSITIDTTGYSYLIINATNLDSIMIEEGTISHDYVPYGHWLKVKNTGKNLWEKEEHGSIDESTGENIYNQNRWRMVDFVEVEGNTDYTLSTKTNTSNIYYIFYYYDKNYNFISSIALVNKTSATNKTPSNCKYMKCVIADTSSIKTTDRQLEKGSTATEYEPYQEQSILIDMNKANLFDKDNANEIDGFVNGNTGLFTEPTNRQKSIYIEIEPNTTYTVFGFQRSTNIGTFTEIPVADTSTATKKVGGVYSWTFTSGSNDKYLVCMYNAAGANYTYNDVKLYEGVGTDDYYELSSIGDTKDELNIDKDGNVSIKQNIGEVVLDGSENWAKNGNETVYYCTSNILGNIKQQLNNDTAPYLISTHFRTVAPSKMWTNPTNDLTITSFISKNNEPRIRYNAISTVDNFKTWLSNNPVTVKYILDKPQTISLGKYDKIEKIDDTENITIQTNIDTTFTKMSYNLINWYNFGNFLITKPTDDDVKDTLTFDSMDYTKKFNKSFDPSGITFPCTALQLAKYCCEECGVELATNEFLNYNFEVIDNQYTNEDTFRNVMQDIGKLAYSWVRIGWDNKCYIDFTYGTEVDEYNKITNDNYYDLEIQQKVFGPVNRVIIGMSNVEGENVYIEDEKSIVEHGVTELQIYDNNLTYTPELRNKVIDSAKVLFGLTYTPMTLNTTGHPWLLGKEKVEVTGMNNTIYYTYPWDRTISYSGHIKSKLESKCDTKTEIEYKYKGDVETVLKKTRIIVNKQENTITSLTQQTTSIQNDLQQNYYDITQTNQLIQTSSTGITNTFSEAGGNNVFRNTGLWFQETEENKWEYWTGIAKKTTNDKAVLGTSILLQNGTFSQEQEVPNGNYSISFYYKLLNPLAKATVKINDNTYELTSTDYKQFYTGEQDENKQYITFPIEVTATHLNISFKTDIDNSVEVYDLMANKGTVKLAYSQNENEITTDTVNISKGITITSSVNDTKFKANADGIRIVDKNNDDKITEFTDKGMTTKEAIIKEEATIVQVLIQNIGDQTWFTRL